MHVITVSVAGRGGPSTEYYYGRGGREMKPDRTVSGGRSYDGEAEQRDSRRRSVQNQVLLTFVTRYFRPAHVLQWSNHLGAMCSRA